MRKNDGVPVCAAGSSVLRLAHSRAEHVAVGNMLFKSRQRWVSRQAGQLLRTNSLGSSLALERRHTSNLIFNAKSTSAVIYKANTTKT